MNFHVLTLFPEMIEQGLSTSITGRALEQNIIGLNAVNIRDFSVEKHGPEIRFTVTGNGFLQNMVRIMAGTLIEVGLFKREPESMTRIIEARQREAAGMMAPPEGLFLRKVEY